MFKFQDQNIVCSATGVGFDSFRGHFADNERVFGFIRIQMGDEMSKRQKFVFLTWVGPKVSVIRRAKMSIDKAMVKNIVKVSNGIRINCVLLLVAGRREQTAGAEGKTRT